MFGGIIKPPESIGYQGPIMVTPYLILIVGVAAALIGVRSMRSAVRQEAIEAAQEKAAHETLDAVQVGRESAPRETVTVKVDYGAGSMTRGSTIQAPPAPPESKRYCPGCGTEVRAGAAYCAKCGTRL
jgi:hypothetical protein